MSPTATQSAVDLRDAFLAMIHASGAPPAVAINALRTTSEALTVAPDDTDAIVERVRMRSAGVEDEIRNAEGGGLSDADFAQKLGVSRETVRTWREKGKIFAWPKDERNLRYPAWQIHRGRVLPGLSEVLTALAERKLSPLATTDYFLTESQELDDRRPLDLLRENHVEEVVSHAARYGDIGS